MDYIQSLDIMSSRNIANSKQGSIDPTKNMTIAALLNVILDLMEQNDSALPDNDTVNFSANASVNGELYMEHERESKDGSLPNTCPLFKLMSGSTLSELRHPIHCAPTSPASA